MNKILGGTVNTTDNQVTAQVKAEPTVAKPATRTAAAEVVHQMALIRVNSKSSLLAVLVKSVKT